MISNDSICMLNAGDRPANVEVFVYYTDREPVGPYPIRIEPRRAFHQQINTIKGQEAVPSGTDYCLVIRSDEPIVAQHTRLDTRQEALALMTTIAYPAN